MSDGMVGKGSQQAPDLIEAVVGFRGFLLQRREDNELQIKSPFQGVVWNKPTMTARCLKVQKQAYQDLVSYEEALEVHGPVPASDCGCGLYAYYDASRVLRMKGKEKMVVALVTLTGVIEAHNKGMRAEQIEVHALALPPASIFAANAESEEQAKIRQTAQLHRARLAAERFDVPLVSYDQLRALAGEFGSPLPQEFRPADQAEPKPRIKPAPSNPVKRRQWLYAHVRRFWWPR